MIGTSWTGLLNQKEAEDGLMESWDINLVSRMICGWTWKNI
jgi:hypothetical protein